MERIVLIRPLTGLLLHSEVELKSGSDTRSLNGPGDISMTVDPSWHNVLAEDGAPYFLKRGTLIVVERANRTIRNVGLVDDLSLSGKGLEVSAGGLSMLAGQSGPWEGYQGYYVTMDPVTVFRRVWDQVQSYKNADLGVRITGATRSGGSVGDQGSVEWQNVDRALKRARPEFDKWSSRLANRERAEQRLLESVFRAAGLKRVGSVTEADSAPQSPGYRADSSLWVRSTDGRVFRWVGDRWLGQDAAQSASDEWREMKGLVAFAKAEVDKFQYQIEPLEERLAELEQDERETFGLYFWQNHDLGSVIEDLTALGPFEFREEAQWVTDQDGNDRLDLQIRVGAPRVGVRRDELHLEFGYNVHDQPVVEYGDLYTGVAQFGAGTGSEMLSAQADWNPEHRVRNILVETNSEANTTTLVRSAANKALDRVKTDAGTGITDLVVHHSKAVREGSFSVGDILPVTGYLSDGSEFTHDVRVLEVTNEWGGSTSSLGVEQV